MTLLGQCLCATNLTAKHGLIECRAEPQKAFSKAVSQVFSQYLLHFCLSAWICVKTSYSIQIHFLFSTCPSTHQDLQLYRKAHSCFSDSSSTNWSSFTARQFPLRSLPSGSWELRKYLRGLEACWLRADVGQEITDDAPKNVMLRWWAKFL